MRKVFWWVLFLLFLAFSGEAAAEEIADQPQTKNQNLSQENIGEEKDVGSSKEEDKKESAAEIANQVEDLESSSSSAKAPVIIDGDQISYLQGEARVIAKGNVVIKHKDIELFCQEVDYNSKSNTAYLKEDVKIVKGNSVIYGEDVIYDFLTSNAEMIDVKVQDSPLYGRSQEGYKRGPSKYLLHKGYITSCDLEKPHYRFVAKRITIYPGDKVVAKDVVLKVGEISLFYLPYFSQSLKDKYPIEEFSPGKNKEWGLFALSRWRYRPNSENRGLIYFDWYEKRGLGFGVANKSEDKDFGNSFIRYYRLKDQLYRLDSRKEFFEIYPEREGIDSKFLEDDRYRAQFAYSHKPNPYLSIDAEFHKFSDEFFLKEYFEEDYEIEPHPYSYVLFNSSLPRASLSLLTQKRANRFWGENEYLPQLELDAFKENIGESNFYFESNDKVGNLAAASADSGKRDRVVRFHSKNILSYADRIKWLSINPYAASYSTFYSRDDSSRSNRWRIAPEMGTTLSTKLYKFLGGGFSLFGERVDKARHVITPEVNYIYRHDPTIPNSQLHQFDGDDSLSRSEQITFTLKNKLQFKNEERTWDFLYFSPSVTYRIKPEGGISRFETISTSLEFYPKAGFSLKADSSYDVWTSRISSFSIDITTRGVTKLIENDEEVERQNYEFSYGHRYSRQSSSQSTTSFTYQVTPKLRFRNYMRYEFNTNTLEAQQYAIRTDLHCWWMDLGIDVDRNTKGSKDLLFWVIFTLKAFDDISIDFDQTYHGTKTDYYRDRHEE